MKQPVVLIAAGGTGGHIFPGLAVADALAAQGCRVEWLGAAGGMEVALVSARGLPIHLVHVAGLRGKGWKRLLAAPVSLWRALRETWVVFSLVRPDCVLGRGGFVAGPGGLMAWLRRVPLVIHEQNAIPGMTNRFLARLAGRVLCGFPGAFPAGAGVQHVGNPVRTDLVTLAPPTERGIGQRHPLRLLVVGGSRGAQVFNQVLPRAIARMPQTLRPEIVHQCGAGNQEDCELAYHTHGVVAQVSEFVDDMQAAYAHADLVLARAGALTLAELAVVGLGAVLVPYPHAVDDHQTANAQALVAAGAARILPQSEFTPDNLAALLEGLLAEPEILLAMAQAARTQARPEAARDVTTICMEAATR